MMKTESEVRTRLLEKAATDSAFRAQLVADPRAAVEQALGVKVPERFSLHVHEETERSAHLVLPLAGDRLSSEEMRAAAGGGEHIDWYR